MALAAPRPVVIVAHSLGSITTTHMGPEAAVRVCGALLVAPADPERRAILSDFAPVPCAALPYRNIVVATAATTLIAPSDGAHLSGHAQAIVAAAQQAAGLWAGC